MLNRRGPVSKLVGGAIGLTKEYQASRSERKTAQGAQSGAASADSVQPVLAEHQPIAPSEKHESSSGDEALSDDEQWALDLDEAQQSQVAGKEPSENTDVDHLLQGFASRHPAPEPGQQPLPGRLPMPVVLPQRRPESRHRGFVRAYAPVLQDCGIDQSAWLEFLDGFEQSIKANPWFHVANASVAIAGHVSQAVAGVGVITFLVTTSIHISMEASRRTYIHYQQNKYLDSMNEQFFKPRGLYCLVIKYKPSSDEPMEEVDLDHNIAKTVEERDGQSKWKNLFSASSSTTRQEAEIPEAAPLIFPQLDGLDETQKEGSVRRFGHFLQDYYDRQAAAKFEAQHPDTSIPQVPRKEFASRYSDPNHPASRGGLISVATGGRYNPVGPLGGLRGRRTARRRSRMGVDGPVGSDARRQRKANRPLRRMLKPDALYLLVVNMPAQAEMDAVWAGMNAPELE